jgi:hypothetical protein
MRHIKNAIGGGVVSARIVPTARNIPVRNIYRDNGFALDDGGVWRFDPACSASLVPAQSSGRLRDTQGQLGADAVD